jgi:hypothetical protein
MQSWTSSPEALVFFCKACSANGGPEFVRKIRLQRVCFAANMKTNGPI